MIDKSKRLSRLSRAFGLALVASLALTALGASSASALKLVNEAGNVPGEEGRVFTAWGGAAAISATAGGSYECTGGSTGSGEFDASGEAGTVKLTFSDCKFLGSKCTTAGRAAGTIATPTLDFKLVYLDAAKTKVGMLLTPPASTPFAKCTFSIFQSNLEWNGSLIGEIATPLNQLSSSVPLVFSGTAGQQGLQQIEGTGPHYHLNQTINGGVASSMSITNERNIIYSGGSLKYIP